VALGEADSSCAADGFFFFEEAGGIADGDSSLVGDRFFFGDGEEAGGIVGDFFGEAVAFFFRWGVGVGAEKIFFNVSPNDCSAALAAGAAKQIQIAKTKPRKIMQYLVGRRMFTIP
jgi:hypothetical protein